MFSYAIQNPSLLPKSFEEAGKKQADATFGERIKGFFVGRLFSDWKDSILTFGVVFYVVKAAVSFFTGYWIVAFIELFTGGFLAMMRKDYRDFTNLHAVTGNLHKEVGDFRMQNLQLRQTAEVFKKEVAKLGEQNNRYARLNVAFESKLKKMDDTLDTAIYQIGRGNQNAKKILVNAKNELEKYSQLTEQMHKDIAQSKKEREEFLGRYEELVKQVSELNSTQLTIVDSAQKRLEEIRLENEKLKGTGAALRNEVTRLKAQISKLEQAADYNLDTAQRANAAAGRLGFFQTLFSKKGEDASGPLSLFITIGLVGAAWAWKNYGTAAAAVA